MYQYGNKVPMLENVKEVDDETATKENNMLVTREPTDSLISGNVENLSEINIFLMIEASATKNKDTIGKLKDDSVFLFYHAESSFHDKLIEIYMEKLKNEQAISECKRWNSFIKAVVGRNITSLSIVLDNVQS